LKALGDNTRYAIYLELARSATPRSTAEIAEALELHPNTVRPHLERMRDVGLLDVETDARGAVGRPQHRYSLAADAPSLGLEPPAFPMLAAMLADVATAVGAASDDAALGGADRGRAMAAACRAGRTSLEDLVSTLDSLGFDPAVGSDDDERLTIAFAHCPFRALSAAPSVTGCKL